MRVRVGVVAAVALIVAALFAPAPAAAAGSAGPITINRNSGPSGMDLHVTGSCPVEPGLTTRVYVRFRLDGQRTFQEFHWPSSGPTPNDGAYDVTFHFFWNTPGDYTLTAECVVDNGAGVNYFVSEGVPYSVTEPTRTPTVETTWEEGSPIEVSATCPVGWDSYQLLFYTVAGAAIGQVWDLYGSVNADRTWTRTFTVPQDDGTYSELWVQAQCRNATPDDSWQVWMDRVYHDILPGTDPTDPPPDPTDPDLGDVNGDGVVRWAVLGDSYISGEGLTAPATDESGATVAKYDEGTDGWTTDPTTGVSRFNMCHRSRTSWAMREAYRRGATGDNVLFAACSGATTEHIRSHAQYPKSPHGVFGGQTQAAALASFSEAGAVDVVLLSIGGNDAKFADQISSCLTSKWQCDPTKEPALTTVREKVRETLFDLKVAAPGAKIIQVGYPTLLEQHAVCPELGGDLFDFTEKARALQFGETLNTQVRLATEDAGAHFLGISGLFGAEGICSAKGYMNGVSVGANDYDGWNPLARLRARVVANESFHPTDEGHDRIRDVVESTVAGFLAADNPIATVSRSPVVISPTSRLATEYFTPTDGTVIQYYPDRNEVVQIGTFSIPTILDEVSVTAGEPITIDVELPPGTAPGIHQLFVRSAATKEVRATLAYALEDTTGCNESVAAADVDGDGWRDGCDLDPLDGPDGDFDGDGVANGPDNCQAVANDGQADFDGDGLGDPCDPDSGGDQFAGERDMLTAPAVMRVAGADAISTAVQASQEVFADEAAAAVVLARVDDYADGLAGTPFAVAVGAPLLLTHRDALADAARIELQRALAPGGRVYVLGGEAALSPAVAAALSELGYEVVRIGGANRFETATSIADRLQPTSVILATGVNFPDGLAGGVLAARSGAAVLLTDGDALPAATATWLATHTVRTTALGGPASRAYPGADDHLVGADRYETARLAAAVLSPGTSIAVATGERFPDALAGGTAVAHVGGALLLTRPTTLPEPTAAHLQSVRSTTISVIVLGGVAAITAEVGQAIALASA